MTRATAPDSTQRLLGQRAALADFGLFAFRCDDVDDLLHRAVELVSVAIEIPLVKVLQHLPERGEMLIRSGVNWQPGVVGHETIGDNARSPGGYALRADHPVVSRNVDLEDRFDMPEVLRRHGVRSMVNVVIVGLNAPFGVLEVDAQELRDFGEEDVTFLRTYANLIAAGIERIKSHEDLKRGAREQAVLARELGHRARNLLGLVRALASQTLAKDRTAEEFREAFIGRLMALSVAEGMVFENSQETVDPLVLARALLAPYVQDDPDKITITGVPARLSSRQGRMFGLALHELATNAAKHGALGSAKGWVRLDWSLQQIEAGDRLVMTWQEIDGPEISEPSRRGFGTRLLENVVTQELDGEARLDYRPDGLVYSLAFPLGSEPEGLV